MTIEIRIDELVLRGFAPLDRARLRAALERELARLIEERGLAGPPAGAEGGPRAPNSGGPDARGGAMREADGRANARRPPRAPQFWGASPPAASTPAVGGHADPVHERRRVAMADRSPEAPQFWGARGGLSPHQPGARIAIAPAAPDQLAALAAAALYHTLAAHPNLRALADASVPHVRRSFVPPPPRGRGPGGEVR